MSKESTHKYKNRLINEKSPYLIQHAHNPVNWYPWSEEAFEKARKEDKPIFLSIGYSTCHWCHVMAHESFEDEEVAEVLNKDYISIKVDREERPDIDSIYMTFCQMLTGQGGWPLSIFMTPDKKPFFAGMYFPKEEKHGRSGFISILNKLAEIWKNNRDKLIKSSEDIHKSVVESMHEEKKDKIGEETVHKTFEELKDFFDPKYGGFGDAPKFPIPHGLMFLLRYWKEYKEEEALKIVEKTLEQMYKGGMFDHIGFGFARYSVDEKWLVPHFEKMLYDNASLAMAYLEAYHATKKELYKEVAEKIFKYIERDMTSPEGGIYSAEDADSEGVEGKFYVWTVDEVKSVLGDNDGELFCKYYDIKKGGNFEGKSIPNLIETELKDIEEDQELKIKLENMRKKLFENRDKRIHPHKDDKILTSWNGLMIAALAYGGKVLENDSYTNSAKKAVDFIFNNLIDDKGRLLARYRDGEAKFTAYLEDYAFLTWGLIELYQNTFEVEYLEKAIKLNKDMIDLYWDNENGGFYLYGENNEQLIVRPKKLQDGAVPSGNSVAALNMLRLAKITGNNELEEKVHKMFETFGGRVKDNPNGYTFFMMALLFSNASTKEIVIAGNKGSDELEDMIKTIKSRYLPASTMVLNTQDEELYNLIPFVKEQNMIDDKITVYVCENFACNQPTTSKDELEKLLS